MWLVRYCHVQQSWWISFAVDPTQYKVRIWDRKHPEGEGQHLTCPPANRIALAQRYFLFWTRCESARRSLTRLIDLLCICNNVYIHVYLTFTMHVHVHCVYHNCTVRFPTVGIKFNKSCILAMLFVRWHYTYKHLNAWLAFMIPASQKYNSCNVNREN